MIKILTFPTIKTYPRFVLLRTPRVHGALGTGKLGTGLSTQGAEQLDSVTCKLSLYPGPSSWGHGRQPGQAERVLDEVLGT